MDILNYQNVDEFIKAVTSTKRTYARVGNKPLTPATMAKMYSNGQVGNMTINPLGIWGTIDIENSGIPTPATGTYTQRTIPLDNNRLAVFTCGTGAASSEMNILYHLITFNDDGTIASIRYVGVIYTRQHGSSVGIYNFKVEKIEGTKLAMAVQERLSTANKAAIFFKPFNIYNAQGDFAFSDIVQVTPQDALNTQSNNGYLAIHVMDNATVFIGGGHPTATTYVCGCVISITGYSVVTVGAWTSIFTNPRDYPNTVKLDSTRLLLNYSYTNTSTDFYGAIISVSGTTFTVGTAVAFGSMQISSDIEDAQCYQVNTNQFLLTRRATNTKYGFTFNAVGNVISNATFKALLSVTGLIDCKVYPVGSTSDKYLLIGTYANAFYVYEVVVDTGGTMTVNIIAGMGEGSKYVGNFTGCALPDGTVAVLVRTWTYGSNDQRGVLKIFGYNGGSTIVQVGRAVTDIEPNSTTFLYKEPLNFMNSKYFVYVVQGSKKTVVTIDKQLVIETKSDQIWGVSINDKEVVLKGVVTGFQNLMKFASYYYDKYGNISNSNITVDGVPSMYLGIAISEDTILVRNWLI